MIENGNARVWHIGPNLHDGYSVFTGTGRKAFVDIHNLIKAL